MSQHYSDPKRASDPHALPNVETFRMAYADCPYCTTTNCEDGLGDYHCDSCQRGRKGYTAKDSTMTGIGWFYWYCFPGCLPDSDPFGPFDTEEDARLDMAEQWDGWDDESEDC